jgi:hypothetical protein
MILEFFGIFFINCHSALASGQINLINKALAENIILINSLLLQLKQKGKLISFIFG